MTRTAARTLTALAAVVLLAATACSGSSDGSPPTTTTPQVATPTTSGALGDLSDLDGAAAGLSGAALDCYNVQLAVSAAAAVPAASVDGTSSPDDLASLQADVATLRGQLPASVTADFDTYLAGVVAYADAVKGIDVSTVTDPATQKALEAAGASLEAPAVQAALDHLQTYLHDTCPSTAGSS